MIFPVKRTVICSRSAMVLFNCSVLFENYEKNVFFIGSAILFKKVILIQSIQHALFKQAMF